MKLTHERFINSLKAALERFYREDAKYPIVSHDLGKQERACAHRIAHFLQCEIGGEFIADCEYEIKWDGQTNSPDSGLRPDIIIHNRRAGEYYAVIEVKVDKSEDAGDFEKLENLTKDKPDVIGIFLGLWADGNYEIHEFKNGLNVKERHVWINAISNEVKGS